MVWRWRGGGGEKREMDKGGLFWKAPVSHCGFLRNGGDLPRDDEEVEEGGSGV